MERSLSPPLEILHEFSNESIPWATVLHKLLQNGWHFHGMQSLRHSPSGPRGPLGHKFYLQTCSSTGSTLRSSASPCQESASARVSHVFINSSQAFPCSGLGFLYGLQVDLCIRVLLHVMQRDSGFIVVCTTDCRGIPTLAPATPPLSPSPLTLVAAELFVLHVFILLCSSCNYNCTIIIFLLLQKTTESLPPFLISPAFVGSESVLEPSGIGSVGHGGSFQKLLTEATTVASLLPKPAYANPVHWANVASCEAIFCLTSKQERVPLNIWNADYRHSQFKGQSKGQ